MTNNWNIKKSDLSEDELKALIDEAKANKRKKWPWSKMNVGDVVEFDRTKNEFKDIETAACMYGSARNKKFFCRVVDNLITVQRIG
jgi:hypothetical protein